MPTPCASVSERNRSSFVISPALGTWVCGNFLFPRLPDWGIDWLISCDLLDQRCHPHTLHYQACSGLIHRRQKLASVVVDACQLPHVDFDLFPQARRGTPRTF